MNNKLLGKIMVFTLFTGFYIAIGIKSGFFNASLIFLLTALMFCFFIMAICLCSSDNYTEAKYNFKRMFEF